MFRDRFWAGGRGYPVNVSLAIFKNIALTRSWRVSGAFTQPDFTGSCLTISHTCFSCLPSRQISPCVPVVSKGSEDAAWV